MPDVTTLVHIFIGVPLALLFIAGFVGAWVGIIGGLAWLGYQFWKWARRSVSE